jgi:hypothetical protein
LIDGGPISRRRDLDFIPHGQVEKTMLEQGDEIQMNLEQLI